MLLERLGISGAVDDVEVVGKVEEIEIVSSFINVELCDCDSK